MNDLTLKLLAIFLSFAIFLQSYCMKRKVGTYLFPPCIFSMAWFIFTIFPLLLLFQIPVNPLGIGYILICSLTFSLSALPFNWQKAYQLNTRKSQNDLRLFDSQFIKYCFFFSLILAIVFAMVDATKNGFDLYKMIFQVMETSNDYARRRNWGQLNYTLFGKLSIMFVYSSASMGGFLYYRETNKFIKNLLLILSFSPALYVMLTQSSKIVLFISIAYFIGSNLLIKIIANDLNIFDKKLFIKIFSYALVLIIPIIISVISRGNLLLVGISTTGLLMHSFNSYILGSFFAFSDFFANYLGFHSLIEYSHQYNYWGRYTFKPFYDAIGFETTFPLGTFGEQYKIINVINTNIYTIFRGLIYDFGIFGSIFFIFISGLVINGGFYKLMCDRENNFLGVFFITSIVFIFFSDLLSLFMARYTLPVFILLYLILKLNRNLSKMHHSKLPKEGK